jgi:RHS repeat-associated protein
MNTQLNRMIRLLALAVLLSAPSLASAYYDPGMQRWINRDPYGEWGVELLRHQQQSVLGDGPNRYVFVENYPTTSIDPDGTQITIPIRIIVPRLFPKKELGGPYVPHSCRLIKKCTTNADYGPNATICTYSCVPGGYSDEIGSVPRTVTYVVAPRAHCPAEPPNANNPLVGY